MAYYFINTMTDTNQLNWQRTNLENIETAWEGDLWDRKRLGIQLTNYVDRLQCEISDQFALYLKAHL